MEKVSVRKLRKFSGGWSLNGVCIGRIVTVTMSKSFTQNTINRMVTERKSTRETCCRHATHLLDTMYCSAIVLFYGHLLYLLYIICALSILKLDTLYYRNLLCFFIAACASYCIYEMRQNFINLFSNIQFYICVIFAVIWETLLKWKLEILILIYIYIYMYIYMFS